MSDKNPLVETLSKLPRYSIDQNALGFHKETGDGGFFYRSDVLAAIEQTIAGGAAREAERLSVQDVIDCVFTYADGNINPLATTARINNCLRKKAAAARSEQGEPPKHELDNYTNCKWCYLHTDYWKKKPICPRELIVAAPSEGGGPTTGS